MIFQAISHGSAANTTRGVETFGRAGKLLSCGLSHPPSEFNALSVVDFRGQDRGTIWDTSEISKSIYALETSAFFGRTGAVVELRGSPVAHCVSISNARAPTWNLVQRTGIVIFPLRRQKARKSWPMGMWRKSPSLCTRSSREDGAAGLIQRWTGGTQDWYTNPITTALSP